VNQRLASGCSRSSGTAPTSSRNGLEAVEALERQPYDLVLMDVQMPEMDGVEATRGSSSGGRRRAAVDRRDDRRGDAGDREGFLAAGMNDYVAKPIRPQELIAAITRDAEPSGDRATDGGRATVRRRAVLERSPRAWAATTRSSPS
jgi:CheY-like chemotaxis protein